MEKRGSVFTRIDYSAKVSEKRLISHLPGGLSLLCRLDDEEHHLRYPGMLYNVAISLFPEEVYGFRVDG